MFSRSILFAAALLAVSACGAKSNDVAIPGETVVSDGPEIISVTIYPDNLAMITETRTVNLPAGQSDISLKGVSDQLIPQSAIITDFGAISIERNFDYDLLSKASLFSEAVGESVTLHRTYPATGDVKVERATIVSGDDGVVLKTSKGLEMFQCSQLSEHVAFDAIPSSFQAEPTLSLRVSTKTAGPQSFTFRYLASGFDWKADYVMTLNDKGNAALAGWLTANNATRISIHDADLSYIAGQLSRRPQTRADATRAKRFVSNCVPKKSTPTGNIDPRRMSMVTVTAQRSRLAPGDTMNEFSQDSAIARQEDVGDYKLYRFPLPVDLNASQTKQLLFLDEDRIDITKTYAFDFVDPKRSRPMLDDGDSDVVYHATERYNIDNKKAGRLAKPLPKGTIRVMTHRRGGDGFYVGGDEIKDTPVGGKAHVDATFSDSVVMRAQGTFTPFDSSVTSLPQSGRHIGTYDLDYQFINMTAEPVAAEFHLQLNNNETLLEASDAPASHDTIMRWFFDIPANSAHTLQLKVKRSRRGR